MKCLQWIFLSKENTKSCFSVWSAEIFVIVSNIYNNETVDIKTKFLSRERHAGSFICYWCSNRWWDDDWFARYILVTLSTSCEAKKKESCSFPCVKFYVLVVEYRATSQMPKHSAWTNKLLEQNENIVFCLFRQSLKLFKCASPCRIINNHTAEQSDCLFHFFFFEETLVDAIRFSRTCVAQTTL